MTLVFMFPGQNSRYPEMIDRLRSWPASGRILARASETLGRDISAHYQGGNTDAYVHNRDVQIGVFLASYIMSRRLAEEGLRSAASLGLSLGEYNHLVEIGALSFVDALRVLDARGCAYQDGPRGLMMSVFPCDAGEVTAALEAGGGRADIAIELGEKHCVLSGESAAVRAAVAWLEEEAYAQARVIDPDLPMHSRVFRPVADAFRMALERVAWTAPAQPYLASVDGRFLVDPQPADFVHRLHRHVFATIRWGSAVREAIERFPGAAFVEVGPKCVLHNAFRREHKNVRSFCTDDPDSADPAFSETVRQLRELHDA